MTAEALGCLHKVKEHRQLTVCEARCCHLVGRNITNESLHPVEDEARALSHVHFILALAGKHTP